MRVNSLDKDLESSSRFGRMFYSMAAAADSVHAEVGSLGVFGSKKWF